VKKLFFEVTRGRRNTLIRVVALLLLAGLAGCDAAQPAGTPLRKYRSGSEGNWLVVQRGHDGASARCWKLEDIEVNRSYQVDGMSWRTSTGALVDLGGWCDRAQVIGNDWNAAATVLGVSLDSCR
jgi:hypothetical protein